MRGFSWSGSSWNYAAGSARRADGSHAGRHAAAGAARLGARSQPRGEARLVPARGVSVNNPLAGHLVDERDGLLQRRFRAGQIVAVDRRADALERAAQPRAELAVVLAVLYTLTMRLERRCVRSHVLVNLRKPLILSQWPSPSTTSAAPTRLHLALSRRSTIYRSSSRPGKSSA